MAVLLNNVVQEICRPRRTAEISRGWSESASATPGTPDKMEPAPAGAAEWCIAIFQRPCRLADRPIESRNQPK